MNLASLPKYPNRRAAVPDTEPGLSVQDPDHRSRLVFKLLLLAMVLVPVFYLRSMPSAEHEQVSLSPQEVIRGRWRSLENEWLTLEFAEEGLFRISWDEAHFFEGHHAVAESNEVLVTSLWTPAGRLIPAEQPQGKPLLTFRVIAGQDTVILVGYPEPALQLASIGYRPRPGEALRLKRE